MNMEESAYRNNTWVSFFQDDSTTCFFLSLSRSPFQKNPADLPLPKQSYTSSDHTAAPSLCNLSSNQNISSQKIEYLAPLQVVTLTFLSPSLASLLSKPKKNLSPKISVKQPPKPHFGSLLLKLNEYPPKLKKKYPL